MKDLNINSKVKLNNGIEMPVIALGTYKVPDGDDVMNEITWALEAGYRSIDTAKIYKNEEGVGKAIKNFSIKREEIFITTKLWNADQGYDTTLQSIDESLHKLGLDYVDLYLVHWPTADVNAKESINKRIDTWKAMEEIYASGKAKAIGVSNYTVKHLEEMKDYAKVLPAVNQVEFHPYLFQKELLEYCNDNQIILEAYRPLTNGQRIDNPVLGNLARKYNKTNAQILIRWSLQHGCVPLPKSMKQKHIKENIEVFDFMLADSEMEEIDSLNENFRFSPDPTNLE